MMSEKEFEELKQNYLVRNRAFETALKATSVDDLKQPGTKGMLAELRLKAITSYSELSSFMVKVPMRPAIPEDLYNTIYKDRIRDFDA